MREVREETDVRVDEASIRFVASQPWLFPRSLLLGFTVKALDTNIKLDANELQDAKWFDASYVRDCVLSPAYESAAAEERFHIPSRTSLAHSLIHGWGTEMQV